MKQATMPIPEIGVIAATRGMLGAGIGLLLASRIPEDRRKKIGWPLLAIGALSTIPLAMDLVAKVKQSEALKLPVKTE
jgi:hypothetical protein